MEPSPANLAPVRDLYGRGLYLQALAAAAPFGPLREWPSPGPRLLAGRLLAQLGGPRLGRKLHLAAFRASPAYPEAIYYHGRYRLERFGPLSAWDFIGQHPDWSDAPPSLRADWLALEGLVWARLRDGDRARRLLARAEGEAPGRPWVLVERSSALELLEESDEALAAARQAHELQPWFRPAAQAVAHILQKTGRAAQSRDWLIEASHHLESGLILAQLAALQLDRGDYADAQRSLERYAELSPLRDRESEEWLAARRCDVAYFLGDISAAKGHAAKAKGAFYEALATRLNSGPPLSTLERGAGGGEVAFENNLTPRPPLRIGEGEKDILADAPRGATPADLLARFWGVDLPAAPDLPPPGNDGLPDCRERRRWADAGWATAEFEVTAEAGAALAARGVPFIVSATEAGHRFSRLAVGADPVRQSLRVADPDERRVAELALGSLRERVAAHGCQGLAAVPPTEAHRLDGVELPERDDYEECHTFQHLLGRREFDAARGKLDAIREAAPGSRLARRAALAWARATAHPVLLLDAANDGLANYPDDSTFALLKASALRDLGRAPERLAALEAACRRPDPDPLLLQSLAQMLISEPPRQREAELLLRRAARKRPGAAAGYFLLGSMRWEQLRRAASADLYRMAACLDPDEEAFSAAYWKVARTLGQAPEALRLFQGRGPRAETPAAGPTKVLYQALWDRDEPDQALAAVAASLTKLQPLADAGDADAKDALGDLLLFRAEKHAAAGRYDEAEADRDAAQPLVAPAAWHQTAARIERTKPRYTPALKHVRAWLADDPLDADGQRLHLALVADAEGRPAARAAAAELAERYRWVYPLARLNAEFLSREPDGAALEPTRRLLDLCPHDAWTHRQLALVLSEMRRHGEAVDAAEEAAKYEPNHPSQYAVHGHVLRRADRVDEALAAFRAGVASWPDHELCIAELVSHGRGKKEKREGLRFALQQLRAKPHSGDGLLAYFEQASRLTDDPEDLERLMKRLDRFLDDRPDLWQAWSACVQQLAGLHRIDEAGSLAREAAGRFPLVARCWLDVAEVARIAEKPDDRLEALHRAAEAAPGWGPACAELAGALQEVDEDDEAERVLRRAVESSPTDPSARWLLADHLWDHGSPEAALEEACRVVRHDPPPEVDPRPHGEHAWAAVNVWADRVEKPLVPTELARDLARDRAGDPRVWLRLARALSDPDQAEEALAALDRAAELDPRNADAFDLKAEKLAQLGRFDEALEAARPGSLATDMPISLQGRAAWVEAKRGNYAAAIPPMQALVAVDPEYVWGWQQLAEWYNDTGKPQSYLEAAGELVRLRPESPFPLAMRGEARLQTGDRDGGKEDLREALRINPGFSPAAAVLFDACLADGEHREARSALAVLQEYLVGPEVVVKQLQYAARTGDADGAARALKEIASHPSEGPSLFLQMALAEMRVADLLDRAEEVLREVWEGDEPFSPWAVVVWLDTPGGEAAEPDERLLALDSALNHFPRFVPALDRKAEQLCALRRFDEAAALCEPPEGRETAPVALRGRAAWIVAQRGDLPGAVKAMKLVLADEPDYTWGWRQLERWYEAQNDLKGRVAAADELVRLNPDDSLSLGLRGEARRAVGDHRGAREDLQRAFDLDPAFEAAGLQLASSQLATDDLGGAAKTIEKLESLADGPLVQLRKAQLAARRGDLGGARSALAALAGHPEAPRSLLREAAETFGDAGWGDEFDEELDAALGRDAAQPPAAAFWVERRLAAGKAQELTDALPELIGRAPDAGREAALTFAGGLAALGRGPEVAAVVQRHSELLRDSTEGWARAGAALAEARQWGLAAAWLGDWERREGRRPWMLRPLADSLRALGRDAEADAVAEAAVAQFDDPPADFLGWLALREALAGRADDAEKLLARADEFGEPDGVKLVLAAARALVLVQKAAPAGRAAAFASAKQSLADAAEACEPKDAPPGLRRWWGRIAARLASDAGTLGARLWAVWQRLRPPVAEG